MISGASFWQLRSRENLAGIPLNYKEAEKSTNVRASNNFFCARGLEPFRSWEDYPRDLLGLRRAMKSLQVL
jgi:hypothetical protein